MTKLVEYTGTADRRVISAGTLSQAGLISEDLVFDREGNFLLSVSDAIAAYLLANDEAFVAHDGSTFYDIYANNETVADPAVISVNYDGTARDGAIVIPRNAAAATAALRKLGTGATDAAAGDDARIVGALQESVADANSLYVKDGDGDPAGIEATGLSLFGADEDGNMGFYDSSTLQAMFTWMAGGEVSELTLGLLDPASNESELAAAILAVATELGFPIDGAAAAAMAATVPEILYIPSQTPTNLGMAMENSAELLLHFVAGQLLNQVSIQTIISALNDLGAVGAAANYTVLADDRHKVIRATAAGITITLPNESAIPAGTEIFIVNTSAGAITIEAGAGATALNESDLPAGGIAFALKLSDSEWALGGQVEALDPAPVVSAEDIIDAGITTVTGNHSVADGSNRWKTIVMNSASAQDVNFDEVTGVTLGTVLTFIQKGAGLVTFRAAVGVTVNSGVGAAPIDSAGQWSVVRATYIDADTWVLDGDIV